MPTASRVVARSACPRPNAETGGSLRARTARARALVVAAWRDRRAMSAWKSIPARATREPRRIGPGNPQPAFAAAAADPEYVRF